MKNLTYHPNKKGMCSDGQNSNCPNYQEKGDKTMTTQEQSNPTEQNNTIEITKARSRVSAR
jgi:hypothetical protein